MKQDANDLMKAIRAGATARQAIELLNIPPKRGSYILQDWARRDWWDYGVVEDLGWLTDMGKVAAEMEVR